MAKIKIRHNPRATQCLDDLDSYLRFCQDYGYKFFESDLYNLRSYPFQQYNKMINGKNFKDQWLEDARKFGMNI